MSRQPKKTSEFDVMLGSVVRSKRVKRKLSQAAVAMQTGIPMSNYQRREDGKNEITVSELERIAAAVNVSSQSIVKEALEDYGGLDKLMAEHAMSEGRPTLTALPAHDMDVEGTTQADYDETMAGLAELDRGNLEKQQKRAANYDPEHEHDEVHPT